MDARCLLPLTLLLGCGPARVVGQSETDEADASATDTRAELGQSDAGDGDDGLDGESDSETNGSADGFVPDEQDPGARGCDIFLQDCADGEKCVPNFGPDPGSFRCVPVLGDQHVGEVCVHHGSELGTDDCDVDSHCWNTVDVDGVPTGSCVPFCQGNRDAADCGAEPGCDGYECKFLGQVGLPICYALCDPLAQQCPDGRACSLDYEGTFICMVSYEPGKVGQACGRYGECEPGSYCVDGAQVPGCEADSCCSPFCDLVDPDGACGALPGTSCADVLVTVDVGCGQIGLCTAP